MTMDLVETRSEGIHTPDYFYDFGGGVPGALAEEGSFVLKACKFGRRNILRTARSAPWRLVSTDTGQTPPHGATRHHFHDPVTHAAGDLPATN